MELRYEMSGAAEPPLSGMLTRPQNAAVDQAWRRLADPANPDRPLAALGAWFARRSAG